MKHLYIFAIICFCSKVNAQDIDKNFIKMEKDSIQNCLSQIIKVAGNYSLQQTDSTKKNNTIFVYSNEQGDELQVHFDTFLFGANPDLKKPGIKLYSLSTIFGQFLTLEKIYAGFFGRKVSQEEILKSGRDRYEPNINHELHTIDFSRYDSAPGYWLIRVF